MSDESWPTWLKDILKRDDSIPYNARRPTCPDCGFNSTRFDRCTNYECMRPFSPPYEVEE